MDVKELVICGFVFSNKLFHNVYFNNGSKSSIYIYSNIQPLRENQRLQEGKLVFSREEPLTGEMY